MTLAKLGLVDDKSFSVFRLLKLLFKIQVSLHSYSPHTLIALGSSKRLHYILWQQLSRQFSFNNLTAIFKVYLKNQKATDYVLDQCCQHQADGATLDSMYTGHRFSHYGF